MSTKAKVLWLTCMAFSVAYLIAYAATGEDSYFISLNIFIASAFIVLGLDK